MMSTKLTRRSLLVSTGAGAITALAACDAVQLPGVGEKPSEPQAPPPPRSATTGNVFNYEVRYSDEEWRERLTPAQYNILRAGGTEPRNSHHFSQTTNPGTYACQGCDLPVYLSKDKRILDIGWVFFNHGVRDSVLLGEDDGRIEAHCRRCGSHLGHVLYVEGNILHCINGTALGFSPA